MYIVSVVIVLSLMTYHLFKNNSGKQCLPVLPTLLKFTHLSQKNILPKYVNLYPEKRKLITEEITD